MTIAQVVSGLLFLQAAVAAPVDNSRLCPNLDGKIQSYGGKSFTIECGQDRFGGNMPAPNGYKFPSFSECIQTCAKRQGCVAVHWDKAIDCYLKSEIKTAKKKDNTWGAVLQGAGDSKAAAEPAAAPAAPVVAAAPVSSPAPATRPVTGLADTVDSLLSADTEPEEEAEPAEEPAPAPVVASPAPQAPVAAPAPAPVASPAPAPVAAAPVAAAPAAPVTKAAPASSDGSCPRPAAKKLATKRGISYNSASLSSLFGDRISWAYNWEASAGTGFNKKLMYIPMLWSSKDTSQFDSWTKHTKEAIANGADTILGQNEPDHKDQANESVDQAVTGWRKFMEPLKCQARLAAPAVTNGEAPMGLTWLKGFLDACTGCSIDVVPIHWYANADNVDYFKKFVQDAYAVAKRPLWISEFGAKGSDAEIKKFFAAVLPWLDSLDYVERYAYFYAADGYLTVGKTRLSVIGDVYNSL